MTVVFNFFLLGNCTGVMSGGGWGSGCICPDTRNGHIRISMIITHYMYTAEQCSVRKLAYSLGNTSLMLK